MSAFRLALTGALALAGAASAQTPAVQTPAQVIGLFSYGYAPNPIVLPAGRPVTLTFVNRSGKGHDFTARKFFRSSRLLSGTVGRDGDIELGPGQSRSVTLIAQPGTYKVHCGHPFHKMLGMRGDIIVR